MLVYPLTKTQEQVLEFLLWKKNEKNTIRSISRKLKKSYTLVYNNIINLEKKELIVTESIPPARLIRLNENAPLEMFINLEFKRKDEFLNKHTWIKIMLKDILKNNISPFFIMLVFGSYAKGLQNEKSDIDLLIIVEDKDYIVPIRDSFFGVYGKVKKSLHIVSIAEFREMLKQPDKLNIATEADKDHILLYGAEQYCNILKNL